MLNRIFVILLIIVTAAGYSVFKKYSLESQLSIKHEAILSKMPKALFDTIDGKPFEPRSLYEGPLRLMVVHFWGTWCGPCERELPEFLTFIKRYEGRSDVKFLLVAVNDDVIKVKKHLKTLNIPSNVFLLLDNKNIHRDIYGTTRVPETYVFSSDSSTLRKFMGPQEWNKTLFLQTFDDFLDLPVTRL
jgi:cytochrome c biogenesis protein CcmG/thiol:disulfide interchange protein DsbE